MRRLAPRSFYSMIRQAGLHNSDLSARRRRASSSRGSRVCLPSPPKARNCEVGASKSDARQLTILFSVPRLSPELYHLTLPKQSQLGARWTVAGSAEVKVVDPSLQNPRINTKELSYGNCGGPMIENSSTFVQPSS
jgi:hypothetical protein